MVAVAGLVCAATSFNRSSLISAMCSWSTHGLAADATARMPPHHPVPITATLIRLMSFIGCSPSHVENVQRSSCIMPARFPAAGPVPQLNSCTSV